MREIRMYGSEGGVVQTNVLSLPLSRCLPVFFNKVDFAFLIRIFY